MSQFFARKVNFFLFHGIVTSARFFWGDAYFVCQPIMIGHAVSTNHGKTIYIFPLSNGAEDWLPSVPNTSRLSHLFLSLRSPLLSLHSEILTWVKKPKVKP